NMAVKERIISRSPALAVKGLKKPITDKPTLDSDEFERLVYCPLKTEYENDVKRAFIFACYTGLRVSDLKTLKFKNIEKKLLTKSNKNRYWIHKTQIKTKEPVEIPISETALELIQPIGAPETLVFPLLAGITTDANRVIKKMAAICKIEKNISFHTARRSCATFMLEAGVDPFTVQKILGHRKIEMTAIYAKTDRTKSKAIESLDELFEHNCLQNKFNVV
ncbi:MAG: integrase catalytic domain-containing protein, partial [Clostridia bacterium]|nr:integrase catalytic domain-containing protein [Clostridia bacterium]